MKVFMKGTNWEQQVISFISQVYFVEEGTTMIAQSLSINKVKMIKSASFYENKSMQSILHANLTYLLIKLILV